MCRSRLTAVNDAPTASGSATLDAIVEDTAAPTGATVSSLFGGHFSDLDGGAAGTLAGIAITANAATPAQGTWQWLDGATWTDISSVSDSNALVLAAGTSVRFVPAADWNGTTPSLTAHLIDGSAGAVSSGGTVDLTSTGTGDTTPYSAGTVALSETVNPVNDAPTVISGNTAELAAIDANTADPSGDTVQNLFGGHFSDAADAVPGGGSSANTFIGIAVTANAATAAEGKWQFLFGGWHDIDLTGIAPGNGFGLAAGTAICLLPAANFDGTAPALTVHLIHFSGSVGTGGTVDPLTGGTGGRLRTAPTR